MPNIVSFSSLRNRDESKDEDNDGQGNTYYAGGNSNTGGGGSGLSVIGPGSGENADQMANIIARAQAAGRSNLEAEGSGQPRHIITFYREGFTVNNGPYRRRDDPENRPFLEAIERGVVPRELEGADRTEEVDISLVDKRHEDYTAPSPPRYTAFSGQGQTLSASSFSADVVIKGDQVSSDRPVIDDKKPTTVLQIRLHNGNRLRETLNLTHTIRDIHAIIQLNGAGSQAYTLLAGFPPRSISGNLDQTIEEAGLKGAAITQKLA